jgi:hypothetical protein
MLAAIERKAIGVPKAMRDEINLEAEHRLVRMLVL